MLKEKSIPDIMEILEWNAEEKCMWKQYSHDSSGYQEIYESLKNLHYGVG